MKDFCRPEKMDVIDRMQALTNFAMSLRLEIKDLQDNMPTDERYNILRECLENVKKSAETTIKKLCKGCAEAFNVELEV